MEAFVILVSFSKYKYRIKYIRSQVGLINHSRVYYLLD